MKRCLLPGPVFPSARIPLNVPVLVNRHTIIHWDVGACILAFQQMFWKKKGEKCTVWSCLILKRSSVWLLCLASSEFPALGPVGGAPNGLWLTVKPHSAGPGLRTPWLLGYCCCVEGRAAGLIFHCYLLLEGVRGIAPMPHDPWRSVYRVLSVLSTSVRLIHAPADICLFSPLQCT